MSIKAYVFDAYGTLFDVHSAVSRHADLVGDNPARVSEIWRNKQLEYTWVRTGMDRYRDFWELTSDALDFALAAVPGSNADCRKTSGRPRLPISTSCYSRFSSTRWPFISCLRMCAANCNGLSTGFVLWRRL